MAWLEERGEWVRGFMARYASEAAAVWVAVVGEAEERGPGPSRRSRTEEVLVPWRALRPPRCMEAHLPPAWSEHGPQRPRSAFQCFLDAQGLKQGDPTARARFKNSTEARRAAEVAARRERRRYDAEVFARNRTRAEAEGQRRPARLPKRKQLSSLLASIASKKRRGRKSPLLHPDELRGSSKSSVHPEKASVAPPSKEDQRAAEAVVAKPGSAEPSPEGVSRPKRSKAKVKARVALRKRERASVFAGRLERTRSGLAQVDLERNRAGKVVNKAKSRIGKKLDRVKPWRESVMRAREEMSVQGLCYRQG